MTRPLPPWRFLIAASLILTAIPLGVAASVPVVNTADLLAVVWPFAFLWTVRPLILSKEPK